MTKGPGRLKSGATKKTKRWKKGQSCVSNPTVTTHRQAATANRFLPSHANGRPRPGAPSAGRIEGGVPLTEKALAHHNEESRDFGISDDIKSAGGETYKTFLSGVSDCSNPAFDKVKRYWESNAASHREVCAVLAAVTEVIREQGGKETETEYFGALMTALDNVESEESLSAILFLLSLVIKRIPASVLRLKFSAISKSFLGILAHHAKQSGTTSLRSCLVCLSTTLRQQDFGTWSEPSTMQVYHGILSYTIHQKPKIRKAAQHAVCAILKGSSFMIVQDSPPCHPAASATAKFCIQKIESSGGTGEVATTMHVLGLLKDVLSCLPQNSLKSACETILRLMTLSNVLMTSVCMQSLHGMFVAKPKPSILPADLNAQLINALYDYQPGENDVQPTQAWLAVMEAAHTNLARVNQKLCISHLPRLFSTAMACFVSQKTEIMVSASQVMKTLLYNCVKPASDWLSIELASNTSTPIHKMFHSVEGGLAYKYHSSWGLVLQVMRTFFEVIGKEGCRFMKKCLQSMCDLRSTHHFPYIQELDRTVGMAVRTMGPRFVLGAVPLQITGDEDNYDFPRSWLLPVIRDNVCNTKLQFFTKYFLPLAAKLKSKALEYSQQGRNVEAKTYDILQSQIWSLLPGFCKDPIDICPGFKGIARILGSALSDRPDLRHDVCLAIRHLVTRNMDNETNRAELARFAKNFLPIFFNIYTSGNARQNTSLASILETAKVYLKIADPKLVTDLFNKLASKLMAEGTDRHPLMDLAIAVTPHLDRDHMTKLFDIVSQLLKSTDHTVQKKAYRILENLCDGSTEAGCQFISSHLRQLQKTLVTSLSTASPSSKGPRLRCIIHIIRALPSKNVDFLETIIPEVILCTKEVNSKTRLVAFDLLVDLGHALIRWSEGEDTREVCVRQYIEMLTAGLAGSPHMVSATVQALTRVLFEFRDVVQGSFLGQLVEGVCTLLQSKAREILSPTLGLVKVLVTILEDVTLAQYVEQLILHIARMGNTNRRNLRVPIRSIYTRFIRKFGYEMIYKLVLEDHKKMVQNIKKKQERTKRHRAMKERQSGGGDDNEEEEGDEAPALMPSKPKPETIDELLQDSESETDEEEEKAKGKGQKVKGRKSKKQQASKQGAAWLKEGQQEDTPLDFLDPSVSKRVLATKPDEKSNKPSTGVRHNFKTMPDGRLIIAEPEEKEEGREGAKIGKKRAGQKQDLEVMDDLEELMEEELATRKAGRKRKVEDLSVSDDENETPRKYQAGGIGIHRPVAVAKRTLKELGREYKAKKAKGDVKKKDKHDPYAYVPLNRQQLNRRMKAKSAGPWKKLAPKGKRGAKQSGRGHKK
ncbi:RRP12-like protein [Acanthaster planci]|uniref:RRP12-like protein n=1 Tax=Acanthaster planci TaxID=133434 RepID=A0A8B7ZM47_ACAPL|nr:RRP12-like protein [Acanthaster planci]